MTCPEQEVRWAHGAVGLDLLRRLSDIRASQLGRHLGQASWGTSGECDIALAIEGRAPVSRPPGSIQTGRTGVYLLEVVLTLANGLAAGGEVHEADSS